MSGKPPPDSYPLEPEPPRVQLVKGQEVSLGCGTLILIALIVIIFGGRGDGDAEREIRQLRDSVERLKVSVDQQTGEIAKLRQQLVRAETPQ